MRSGKGTNFPGERAHSANRNIQYSFSTVKLRQWRAQHRVGGQ